VGAIQGMLRERRFYSPALDREMSYYVYFPPGYGTEGQRYPVLYMLHGGGGSKDEWLAYGLVDSLDRLIASHDVQPMILVLPQGDTGYWVNQPNGGARWGDYVATDLVRQVDATFRTRETAAQRAIGGYRNAASIIS
jgi:enterochelin esterase-like enzyme